MRSDTIALFFVLAILSSCRAQNTSELSTEISEERDVPIALGDTVPGLEESAWIIFQDSKEHYWFGSDGQGVYRYDGNSFIRFTTEQGLANNRIRGIQEDASGNVFVSTLSGISRFDGRRFSILPVTESNDWKADPKDLWFCALGMSKDGGPYRFDGTTLHHLKLPESSLAEAFYKSFPNASYSPYDVYSIYKDRKGSIWFGTSNLGICRFNGSSHDWLYEDHWTNTPQGGSFGIRAVIEDREGDFWICNTMHRYKLINGTSTEQDKLFVDYQREPGIDKLKTTRGDDMIYFMSAVVDDHGDLWMSTYDQGVWKYDGIDITRYPVFDGSDEIKIFSIYKDRKGALWLGTLESGAYRFDGVSFVKFNP